MTMSPLKTVLATAALALAVQGAALLPSKATSTLTTTTIATVRTTTCVPGSPTTTAGYPIDLYVQATPASGAVLPSAGVSGSAVDSMPSPSPTRRDGYQPEPSWASRHFVRSYTFAIPRPVETGFAYAQFKCQYYCTDVNGGSFFVRANGPAGPHRGSTCHCYDEVLDPATFVHDDQTLVGAWNAICSSSTSAEAVATATAAPAPTAMD